MLRRAGSASQVAPRSPPQPPQPPDEDMPLSSDVATSPEERERALVRRISAAGAKQWTCCRCTFVNVPTRKFCKNCGKA